MKWVAISIFAWSAGTAAIGCGGSHGSPQSAAEEIVSSLSDRNVQDAKILVAPVAKFKEYVQYPLEGQSCETAGDDGGAKWRCLRCRANFEQLDHLDDQFEQAVQNAEEADHRAEITTFDEEGSVTKELKQGDAWRDCAVKKPFKVHWSKFGVDLTENGETETSDGELVFIEMDGLWYVLASN